MTQEPGAGEEYLTPQEVATLLRVSKATVYALVRQGELPARRFRKSIRIMAAGVTAMLRGQS